MSHKNTINDGDYQHHPIVIGDLLLHTEIKLTPIQVIIQPLIDPTSLTLDKPIIPRVLPNSSDITNNQTKTSCDLQNPTIVKLTRERTSSSKKIMLVRSTSWRLVKELRSKVITIEPKIHTADADSDNVQTRF